MAADGPPELTIDEFAAWADPPFRNRRQLADLITALGIPATGTRPRPVGRPALTYPAAVLMRLHAGVAEWLPDAADSGAERHIPAPETLVNSG